MVGDNKRWSMQFNGLRMWMTQWWEEDVGDILQLTISARFLSYTHANLLPGRLTAATLATGTLCLTCHQSVTTPCLLFMSGWFISLLMLYAKATACLTYLPTRRNVFSFTVNTILRTFLAAGPPTDSIFNQFDSFLDSITSQLAFRCDKTSASCPKRRQQRKGDC